MEMRPWRLQKDQPDGDTLNWRTAISGILLLLSLSTRLIAQGLPILGLAHVGIGVSDIDKSEQFYTGVLGLDMAFNLIRPDGKTLWLQYYKVNEHQYLEIYPTLKPDAIVRETHVAFFTDDIQKLHQMMEARGLKPSPLGKPGADGNISFVLRPAPGQDLLFMEFVQYMPGSKHLDAQGKSLSPRRISTRLISAGVLVNDLAVAEELCKTLGFREIRRSGEENGKVTLIDLELPGDSGDYVELLEGPHPVTAEQAGRAGHLTFEVRDVHAAYKEAKARKATIVAAPTFNGLKVMNFSIKDPDSTVVVFQQARAHR
jgi:catechol 2,3-dioxygenase-like lactoylglutathione lyase family enzyme